MDYYYGEETKENQGEKKSVTEVAKEVLAGDWATEMTARIDWLLPDMTTQRCRQK